jgi:hypothetical protein
MSDSQGRRNAPLDDPTSEPTSDPVPTGEDVVDRYKRGHDTPRRYEQPCDHDKDLDSTAEERSDGGIRTDTRPSR